MNGLDLNNDMYHGALSPSVVIQGEPLKILVRRFKRQGRELVAQGLGMEVKLSSVPVEERRDPVPREAQIEEFQQWPEWGGVLDTGQLEPGSHEFIFSSTQGQKSFEISLEATIVHLDALRNALQNEKEESTDTDPPVQSITEVDQILHEALQWMMQAQEWQYHDIDLSSPPLEHRRVLSSEGWPGFMTPVSAFSWIFRTAASITYDLCFFGGLVVVQRGLEPAREAYFVRFNIGARIPFGKLRETHRLWVDTLREMAGVETFEMREIDERRASILMRFLPRSSSC